jgi:hypothetical protein
MVLDIKYISKTKGAEMSKVKKWLLVLVVILTIASMVFMAGCGKQTEMGQTRSEVKASETVAAVKETVAATKVNGVIYEADKFSILQPDGWKAEKVSDGVSFNKGDDSVAVEFGDGTGFTDDYLKKLTETLAKQKNGTPVEEVTFGAKFFLTRFTTEGIDMTEGWGLTNGEVVSLVMTGKDHPNNVEIKAMLESLKFK